MTTRISDTFWADYINEAMGFAVLPMTDPRAREEAMFGLIEEAGEVAGVFKRATRGDNDGQLDREKLAKELGDLLWYTVRHAMVCEDRPGLLVEPFFVQYEDSHSKPVWRHQVASYLQSFGTAGCAQRIYWLFGMARFAGMSLREVATKNLEKLRARKQAGTIQGSGDNR